MQLSIFFSDEQLKHGAILLYFFGSIYLFTLLTVVCNDYFLPTVEVICDRLSISKVSSSSFLFKFLVFFVFMKHQIL